MCRENGEFRYGEREWVGMAEKLHSASSNGYIQDLSSEDGRDLFDRQARRYLGVGGEEFLRRLEAGEYGDPDDDPRVMRLVMLLPFARA